MALDREDPAFHNTVASLGGYLERCLERAGEEAARLFSDEVTLEHLIGVLLADEDAALHQLVLHAIADPETIAVDVLALTPGILVVASDAILPFSALGVEAVKRARETARAANRREVTEAALLVGATAVLADEVRAALAEAGLDGASLAAAAASEGAPGELPAAKSLFHGFSLEARRALSRAARAAVEGGEPSIGPARIALAALAAGGLDERVGLSRARAALVLRGRTADTTPPPPVRLRAGAELTTFLAALPPGAGSLDVLAALHRDARAELTQAFTRQKVSPELLAHARSSFSDPER